MKYFIYLLLSTMILTQFSCTKDDPCKGITCLNSGFCNTGRCNCGYGYEGTLCESAINAKFSGVYYGTITFTNTGHQYLDTFTVVASISSPDAITLSDNGFVGLQVYDATVYNASTSTFFLNAKTISTSPSYIVLDGNGSLSGNSITLSITAQYNGSSLPQTFTGVKH